MNLFLFCLLQGSSFLCKTPHAEAALGSIMEAEVQCVLLTEAGQSEGTAWWWHQADWNTLSHLCLHGKNGDDTADVRTPWSLKGTSHIL